MAFIMTKDEFKTMGLATYAVNVRLLNTSWDSKTYFMSTANAVKYLRAGWWKTRDAQKQARKGLSFYGKKSGRENSFEPIFDRGLGYYFIVG